MMTMAKVMITMMSMMMMIIIKMDDDVDEEDRIMKWVMIVFLCCFADKVI